MPSNGQQPSFSSETYREDIVFLRDVFPSIDRSFTDSSLGRFHARLATLLDQLGELTFASFAMGVAHCLAAADNAHTMPVLRYRLRVVPLRVHWFSDGLYAIRSLAGPADLVGACLVGIDGKSPEYWLGGLKEYIGGNSARHRAMSTFFLVCPGALASIDPSASADRLTFTYRGKSGVESECTLEIAALERNIEIFPRRDPGIAFLDAAGTGWRQALDGISVVPLYLRDSGKSAFHEWLPELRAMFIRIRSTTDDHDFSLPDYFDKVIL